MDICMMCYWGGVDDGMLVTAVRTFRKVNKTAELRIYYDDMPNIPSYDVVFCPVKKETVTGRRAIRKIELLQDIINTEPEGTRIVVSDIDVYFLQDPFDAFKLTFDLGITTRCEYHDLPVNAGLFCIRNSEKMREFSKFRLQNLKAATWPLFAEFEKSYRPKRHLNFPNLNPDWFIDQDFLNIVWQNKALVEDKFGITVSNLGCYWNYCPDSFGDGGYDKANRRIKKAYETKSVGVLHLKSHLKLCRHEGWLPDAVTLPKPKPWNWYESNG